MTRKKVWLGIITVFIVSLALVNIKIERKLEFKGKQVRYSVLTYSQDDTVRIKLMGRDVDFSSSTLSVTDITVSPAAGLTALSSATTGLYGVDYVLTLGSFSRGGLLTLSIAGKTMVDRVGHYSEATTLRANVFIKGKTTIAETLEAGQLWCITEEGGCSIEGMRPMKSVSTT